eukprot:TRINITY_DN19098_c0_g1_i1.p1 TRINITY_DN19098_c0_g1~~TRINITY_DN19098_c0_g1_i1.p1  ORF type:complete len:116 (-),score=37.83 TRINITY_DN19098_c0_g1_i1:63-410(-)
MSCDQSIPQLSFRCHSGASTKRQPRHNTHLILRTPCEGHEGALVHVGAVHAPRCSTGEVPDSVLDPTTIHGHVAPVQLSVCLLYTSDAADDLLCVDLGGRRIIKKKKKDNTHGSR